MGTCNYHKENATKFYYAEPKDEEDEFYYYDLISNLQHELKAKDYEEIKEYDNDQSRPGRYFAINKFTVESNNKYMHIYIRAIARQGYHEGVNLDYEYSIEVESDNYWDNEVDLSSLPKGFKTLAKKAKAKLKKEAKALEKIFNIYANSCY